MIAGREEIVILESSRSELGGAFQTIGALHQKVGDQFETVTRVRWDEALQLLYAANGVLSGGVSTTVEQAPGRPRVAVFAMSQSGWGESLRIGLSIPAARLLLRCCAGALEYIDAPEFSTLTGAERSAIRHVMEILEGLGVDA